MDDLHMILADHVTRKDKVSESLDQDSIDQLPTCSDIPDIFFDEILVQYKLSRIEILVLMYLYRRVWCRPNLYKMYGISQLMSHTEMAKVLGVMMSDIYSALKKLEDYDFISTIRSGQYFVRRYFTRVEDDKYCQDYDELDF